MGSAVGRKQLPRRLRSLERDEGEVESGNRTASRTVVEPELMAEESREPHSEADGTETLDQFPAPGGTDPACRIPDFETQDGLAKGSRFAGVLAPRGLRREGGLIDRDGSWFD